MTVEEKAQAIKDFCDTQTCLPNKCPLLDIRVKTCWTDEETFPEEIEKNYEFLKENGLLAFQKDSIIAPNAVNHPSHYTNGGIECIAAIKASMTTDGFADYCKGNVLKYIWRWRDKGGVEDLKKARVYLNWLIEAVEK